MRKPLYTSALLLTIVVCFSCHRTKPVKDCCDLSSDAGPIVGKWDWVSVGEGNVINYNTSSGIKRSLTFTADGHLYMTHNDASTGRLIWVPAPALLGKTATDSTGYHFEQAKAPCVNFLYTAMVVDSEYYQFFLSHDTLQFSAVPCLAPVVSTYIRGK